MYSPKINEQLIPTLYHLGKHKKKPMTHLVDEAITQYLEREAGNVRDIVAQAKIQKR